MFAFDKIIPKRSFQVSIPLAQESAPKGYLPRDSREFFRVDTEILLCCRPLLADRHGLGPVWQQVNLSGGGIRFSIAEPLHVGEKAWLELQFPDLSTAPIRCLGRVVRLLDNETGERQAAVEFENLTARDQDRIIAFCLAEQRKLLREKVRVRHC